MPAGWESFPGRFPAWAIPAWAIPAWAIMDCREIRSVAGGLGQAPSDRVRAQAISWEMAESPKSFLDILKSRVASSEPPGRLPYTPVQNGTPSFMDRR